MLADTIGGILGRSRNGGKKIFHMVYSTDAISFIKVLEVPLPKDTPDEQADFSGITIKFALTAEIRRNVGADELQATDAVDRATEMVNVLGPTPQIVGLVDSATNTSTNVAAGLQTFENTWGVLLQRMALFNKIVGGIAEAFCFLISRPPFLTVA